MGVRVLDRLIAWKCYRRAHALVQINNGFYCTRCNSQCYSDGDDLYCECGRLESQIIYGQDYPNYWAPVTITIRKRKSQMETNAILALAQVMAGFCLLDLILVPGLIYLIARYLRSSR